MLNVPILKEKKIHFKAEILTLNKLKIEIDCLQKIIVQNK